MRVLYRLTTLTLVCALSLFLMELGLRAKDGFRLGSVRLESAGTGKPIPATDERHVERYIEGKRDPVGVNAKWFSSDPPPLSPIPLSGVLQQRHERYPRDPYAAYFEWNLAYLQQQACGDTLPDILSTVAEYFYFTSPDGSLYPTYRHSRHATPPGWFTSNSFGWRGPELSLNKPPQTIRIAFVGASTTISPYDYPYSHPEFIEHWLNLWSRERGWPYRFETINAGRTGINSRSIAAIVRQELVPVEPDLVVFYEGSNQFWPANHIQYRFGRLYPKPRTTFRARMGEGWSAVARRTWHVVDTLTGGEGGEPMKPPQHVVWPPDVDEEAPDPQAPDLPLQLSDIVSDLDDIRSALQPIGSELVLSSFIWMVENGLRLDLDRDAGLYHFLNGTYWPITYANMRRFADFQNRVFARYAQLHQLPFADISRDFPRDPALFGDAIHLRYDGLRLQAWMFFEALASLLDDRIGAGTLPRPQLMHHETHPAFDQPSGRTMTLKELRAKCS